MLRNSSPTLGAGPLLVALSICAAPALAVSGFETAPDRRPEDVLPAELVSGPDHRVVPPVRSDGTTDFFRVESRFGDFEVAGRPLLEIRIGELAALAELERVSTTEVFLQAAARTAKAQAEAVAGFAAHPVETVRGIPGGVANLFRTYRARTRQGIDAAREVGREVGAAVTGDDAEAEGGENGDEAGGELLDQGEEAARRYALRYLGVSAAERRWARKLGVDPYSSNERLRTEIADVARVDAAASFGLRFVGLPTIPGVAHLEKTMEIVWTKDPALIREENRERLGQLGLDSAEIRAFEDQAWLSPTRQLLLLELLDRLNGVAERAEILRRSFGIASEEEAVVFLGSVALLADRHARSPLAKVLPGTRLPAARTEDGVIVVCAAFDTLFWTERVAEGADRIRSTYGDLGAARREVVLAGPASARAREEIGSLGWTLQGSKTSNRATVESE